MPVADLRKRFDMDIADTNIDTRFIVTEIDFDGVPTLIAIVADKVHEVTEIPAASMEEAPKIGMHWRPSSYASSANGRTTSSSSPTWNASSTDHRRKNPYHATFSQSKARSRLRHADLPRCYAGNLSSLQTAAVNDKSSDIADNWLPSVDLANRMNTATSDFRISEMQHVTTQDDVGMKKWEGEMTSLVQRLSKMKADYEEFISTPEGRRCSTRLRASGINMRRFAMRPWTIPEAAMKRIAHWQF